MINYIAIPFKSFTDRIAITKKLEEEMEGGEAKKWFDIQFDNEKECVLCKYSDFRKVYN